MKEIKIQTNEIGTDTLDCMNNREMIAFINSVFSKNFAQDESVVKISYDYTDERYNTYFQRISETPFLILFDYQVPDSNNYRRLNPKYFVNMNFESDTIQYILPEIAIISAGENEKLTIQVSAMNNAEHFEYSAVTVNMCDFGIDEMIEKCLFPFIPFYSVRFEKILFNPHTAEDEIKIFEEMMECAEKIKAAARSEKIGWESYEYLGPKFIKVFKNMIKDVYSENLMIHKWRYIDLLLKITEMKTDLKKERITHSANNAIEIYNRQYQILTDEGIPAGAADPLASAYARNFVSGFAEKRAKTIRKVLKEMLENNFSEADMMNITGVTKEEFKIQRDEIYQEMNDEEPEEPIFNRLIKKLMVQLVKEHSKFEKNMEKKLAEAKKENGFENT